MDHGLKFFFIRLAALLVATPVLGFILLRAAEDFEKIWKKGSTKQKWLRMCILVFALALAAGFLR